jgi:hypothetical protein
MVMGKRKERKAAKKAVDRVMLNVVHRMITLSNSGHFETWEGQSIVLK